MSRFLVNNFLQEIARTLNGIRLNMAQDTHVLNFSLESLAQDASSDRISPAPYQHNKQQELVRNKLNIQ